MRTNLPLHPSHHGTAGCRGHSISFLPCFRREPNRRRLNSCSRGRPVFADGHVRPAAPLVLSGRGVWMPKKWEYTMRAAFDASVTSNLAEHLGTSKAAENSLTGEACRPKRDSSAKVAATLDNVQVVLSRCLDMLPRKRYNEHLRDISVDDPMRSKYRLKQSCHRSDLVASPLAGHR
ncbi:hypothetical protein MRX96_001114 [Rhipicephalus microplus]